MKYQVKVNEKTRLDQYLTTILEESRSEVTRRIKSDCVLVNGRVAKASLLLKDDDVIELLDYEKPVMDVVPTKMDLDILYEDRYLMVINKPSGLTVHPGAGNYDQTLVNGLMYYTKDLSDVSGDNRLGIVHRIDKDTSGLMIVCKDNKVHPLLAEGFKNKTIKRDYIALLVGEFPHASATINAPIGRDSNNRKMFTVTDKNSKDAITEMKVLKRYIGYTLVKCSLKTGRTHQIRVHMKYIGYPVYNDPVYTNAKATKFGQFLHSAHLEFVHPITKEALEFDAPLPNEFQKFIDNLEEYEKI
ncbi:MAG: RluA family pseudouridine synthase [Bacilli bacterium]|nr:RluA family pseudouridine synthase [Bacilli bacterium]